MVKPVTRGSHYPKRPHLSVVRFVKERAPRKTRRQEARLYRISSSGQLFQPGAFGARVNQSAIEVFRAPRRGRIPWVLAYDSQRPAHRSCKKRIGDRSGGLDR